MAGHRASRALGTGGLAAASSLLRGDHRDGGALLMGLAPRVVADLV